jgi:hypothetical protein
MKLFLRKFAVFVCIGLMLFTLLLFFLTFINNRALKNYSIPPYISQLFIGDSHIQLGINDKLLPNSKNLANPGEALYYTYYKLAPILTNNPSIKRVYLGFSYHNISSYINDNIYGIRSKDIAPRYFFILPFSEKIKIIAHNRNSFPTFFRNVLTRGFYTLFTKNKDFSFIGTYENNFIKTAAVKELIDKRILVQYYENNFLRDYSYINITYLNKIIDLCKKNKVELILMNTPIQSYYQSRIPQKFIKKYSDIIKKNGLKNIAFQGLQMNDSCFIGDGDHLSQNGAQIITKFLAKNDSL